MMNAKKCAKKLHHFERQIRYYNIREVATHKIRNTVTQGKGYRRGEHEKGLSSVHVRSLPMTATGLRSSLPFRDGEGGHLYVYEQRTGQQESGAALHENNAGRFHPFQLAAVCQAQPQAGRTVHSRIYPPT